MLRALILASNLQGFLSDPSFFNIDDQTCILPAVKPLFSACFLQGLLIMHKFTYVFYNVPEGPARQILFYHSFCNDSSNFAIWSRRNSKTQEHTHSTCNLQWFLNLQGREQDTIQNFRMRFHIDFCKGSSFGCETTQARRELQQTYSPLVFAMI